MKPAKKSLTSPHDPFAQFASPTEPFNDFFRTPEPDDILKEAIHPLKIGDVILPNNLILAPMAGVTDGSFRYLCSRFGAGMSVSELISSRALIFGNKRTIEAAVYDPIQRPYSVQLFGYDPKIMAEAAKIVEGHGICDIIDINMGCPVSKVVKTGAGSALMKTPKLAAEIFRAVKNAVNLPVTVKFRLGWTQNTINHKEFTKIMISEGADAICIHARTREAAYSGEAQWEQLVEIKEICGSEVPFIANGDITSVEDIAKLHKMTNCDAFMIGRASIGNPWIFAQILHKNLEISPDTRYQIFKTHFTDALMEHGAVGVALFRSHLFNYIKGYRNATTYRRALSLEKDPLEVLKIVKEIFL